MTFTRRSFLVASVAAVGSAVALASGCATPAPAAPPTAAPTLPPILAPTQAPTVPTTLKLGILLPYNESSIGVDIGLNQKRAADLYMKQHGGKLAGRAVDLVYSAESIEAGVNKTKVKTLTDTEHVELLVGGASSDTGQVMRDAAEALKIVYVDTNATANALSRSNYVFRTSASAWQLSEPLGEWASKSGKSDFYVCGVDDIFGSESIDAFVAGLGKSGGNATSRNSVASGGDWTNVVAAIKAQPTKNVFAAFQIDDADGFVAEWAKQDLSAAGYSLYGPGPLCDEEVLNQEKSAAVGVTSSLFWAPDLDNAENRALVDAFPKAYIDDDTGEPVRLTGYAVAMWDAMGALDLALQQTGGVTSNADALIAALEGVSFKSPRGTFAFDKTTHNPVQAVLIRKVETYSSDNVANRMVATIPSMAVTYGPG